MITFYVINITVSEIGEFLGILVVNPLPIYCFYNNGVCELKKLINFLNSWFRASRFNVNKWSNSMQQYADIYLLQSLCSK